MPLIDGKDPRTRLWESVPSYGVVTNSFAENNFITVVLCFAAMDDESNLRVDPEVRYIMYTSLDSANWNIIRAPHRPRMTLIICSPALGQTVKSSADDVVIEPVIPTLWIQALQSIEWRMVEGIMHTEKGHIGMN